MSAPWWPFGLACPRYIGIISLHCATVQEVSLIRFARTGELAAQCKSFRDHLSSRHKERPQRPLQIWGMDVSKQVFSMLVAHICGKLLTYFAEASARLGMSFTSLCWQAWPSRWQLLVLIKESFQSVRGEPQIRFSTTCICTHLRIRTALPRSQVLCGIYF